MRIPKRKTDPCPCGSGKQYRYCHGFVAPEDKAADDGAIVKRVRRDRRQVFLWIVLLGAPTIYIITHLTGGTAALGDTRRVWSAEHGHYHDVAPSSAPAPAPAAAATADGTEAAAQVPQAPPGPTPPGKIWSAEHGHWHDATPPAGDPDLIDPATGAPWDTKYRIPQPEGEAPEGKTWSEAHGHWHDAAEG